MSKLLEKAIVKVWELPEDDQDEIALAVLSMAEAKTAGHATDEATRAAILRGLEQARRGEFVRDEDLEALWKRHGL